MIINISPRESPILSRRFGIGLAVFFALLLLVILLNGVPGLSAESNGKSTVIPAEAQYKEDFNGDGNINIVDVIALLLYQRANPRDSKGDYNGDCTPNIEDAISLLLAQMAGRLTPVDDDVSPKTIHGTIVHDELYREYILYVPASYNGCDPVPLVFNFHGYTTLQHVERYMEGEVCDFRPVADSAGFIVVYPKGTPDNDSLFIWYFGDESWNLGDITQLPDDLGFTESLLDYIASEYNIDLTRVYATGFSLGGFFSYYLACHLSDRFAAIASVKGTMWALTFDECDPQQPTPILQISGTDDPTVPYFGSNTVSGYMEPIETVIQYWVNYNNCNPTPTTTALPDINPADWKTVHRIVYSEGDNGVTVEFIVEVGGVHDWPTSLFTSVEIWKFLSKYDINGLR